MPNDRIGSLSKRDQLRKDYYEVSYLPYTNIMPCICIFVERERALAFPLVHLSLRSPNQRTLGRPNQQLIALSVVSLARVKLKYGKTLLLRFLRSS